MYKIDVLYYQFVTKLGNEKYCNNTSLMATGLSQNLSSKNNNFL